MYVWKVSVVRQVDGKGNSIVIVIDITIITTVMALVTLFLEWYSFQYVALSCKIGTPMVRHVS